ncbi:MAG TPA: DNA gyrase C-terminal beta-propeller domain-containing protein, partial [Candidatus Deferrimicrobiaceae bacterium]
KVTERTGSVVGVAQVADDDDVMIVTDGGMIIRTPVGQIRLSGRNTQGVRLIDVRDDQRVMSFARLAEKEVTDQAGPAEEPETPEPGQE